MSYHDEELGYTPEPSRYGHRTCVVCGVGEWYEDGACFSCLYPEEAKRRAEEKRREELAKLRESQRATMLRLTEGCVRDWERRRKNAKTGAERTQYDINLKYLRGRLEELRRGK